MSVGATCVFGIDWCSVYAGYLVLGPTSFISRLSILLAKKVCLKESAIFTKS